MPAAEAKAPPPPPTAAEQATLAASGLYSALTLIERFVLSREQRLMSQALRCVGPLRKTTKETPSIGVAVVLAAINSHVAPTSVLKAPITDLLKLMPQPAADVLEAAAKAAQSEAKALARADESVTSLQKEREQHAVQLRAEKEAAAAAASAAAVAAASSRGELC